MTNPTIETARALLADASPELRQIIGECIEQANLAGYFWAVRRWKDDETAEQINRCDAEWDAFSKELRARGSSELIEAGKQ